MPEQSSEPPKGYSVEWNNDHASPIQFADALHWRVGADRCYLSIGQFNLPTQEAPFPDGTTVRIEPIARLVVTADTLKMWAQLLNQAVEFLATQGAPK